MIEEKEEAMSGTSAESTGDSPSAELEPTPENMDQVDPLAVLRVIRGALELLPLLAPFALLAGWLTVAAYARSLGLQPGDLDLGITEILVLASINLFFGLLLSAGLWLLQSGGRRRQLGGLGLIAGSGILLFSSASVRGVGTGLGLGVAALLSNWTIYKLAGRGSDAVGKRQPSHRGLLSGVVGIGLTLYLVLIAFQMFAAHSGGSALRRGESADLPLALTMTLPADRGMLDGECVVRVARRVFVNPTTGVVVLSAGPEAFTLGCESD